MIGVLALQGAFLEHLAKFVQIGVPAREVRTPSDLVGCDGLVIPGGESTAIALIAERSGMLPPLRAWVQQRKPTWGTCAGMIMLADRAIGTKEGGQALLGGVPVEVHRNFFGAQAASFEAPLQLAEDRLLQSCLPEGCTGVFIRAPAILSCGEGVRPLAWVRRQRRDAQIPTMPSDVSGDGGGGCSTGAAVMPIAEQLVIVAAETGPFLVTAFHPELTDTAGWHAYFATIVAKASTSPQSWAEGAQQPILGRIIGETTTESIPAGPASSHVEIARRIVPGKL